LSGFLGAKITKWRQCMVPQHLSLQKLIQVFLKDGKE
jgi:hypothetical protein